jgi:N-acyl-D-aspartate/D-glutamate deacylase
MRLELIKHPRTAVTFSDSGAHVSQIMDASLQTHLLAHWVRDKQALTLEQAVRMLSFDNATHWGFADRGLIREGFAADLVVFDPATVGPEMPEVAQDLPAGARRLVQRSRGFAATVVNGETVLRRQAHGRSARPPCGGRSPESYVDGNTAPHLTRGVRAAPSVELRQARHRARELRRSTPNSQRPAELAEMLLVVAAETSTRSS